MDTGSGPECGSLWAEDGVYEYDDRRADGPAGVAAMAEAEYQAELTREGCAHVMAMPLVELDGDTGVATCYSRVYRHGDDPDARNILRRAVGAQLTPSGLRREIHEGGERPRCGSALQL
jgi:hypothetical protein